MKVFISVDMEGIAGIATLDQIARGGFGYERAQALMTAEANAAIAGAFDGGAEAVVVNDSHGTMDNLLHDRLDSRARLVFGLPKAECMAEGVSADDDVALFVGYHAPAGGAGVLAHTFSSYFGEVRLNGTRVSEMDVNALQLAAVGVPLGLVVGDDVICGLAQTAFPDAVTLCVKHAHGWSAASSLAPSVACTQIRVAAAEAVGRAPRLSAPALPASFTLEVDLPNETAMEVAAGIPGVERIAVRTLRRDVASPAELVGLIGVLYQLSARSVVGRQIMVNRR